MLHLENLNIAQHTPFPPPTREETNGNECTTSLLSGHDSSCEEYENEEKEEIRETSFSPVDAPISLSSAPSSSPFPSLLAPPAASSNSDDVCAMELC